MKYWYVLLAVVALAGCAETHSGGVDKRYDVTINVTGDNNSFSMGVEADTAAESTAGDADATVDPRVSGSLYGPSNVEGIMKDLSYIIEKWNKIESENTEVTNPEVVPPSDGPVVNPTDTTDDNTDNENVTTIEGYQNWEVYKSYPCDNTMTFHDETETVGVEQKKCLFTDINSCEELPNSFMLIWQNDTKLEQLQVPDKCTMAWVTKDKDYRKYRPEDDKEPHPVGYAPRGFDAKKIHILIKKSEDTADCILLWDGKDPDPAHDRAWWS